MYADLAQAAQALSTFVNMMRAAVVVSSALAQQQLFMAPYAPRAVEQSQQSALQKVCSHVDRFSDPRVSVVTLRSH